MKIILQSGNSLGAIRAVQRAFAAARERLATVGVLYPQSCGSPGQADLWQASLARADTPDVQEPDDAGAFGARVRAALGAEIVAMRPKAMVLIVPEAALWCVTPPKLAAFRDLLADFSDDLHILLSMAPPPDALTDIFIEQIRLGRFADLSAEAAVAADPDGWWTTAGRMTAASADGPVVQGPVPAVDAAALENLWRGEFGGAILTAQIAPATPAGVAKLMAGLAELADVPKAHLNPSDAVIEPRPPVAALRRRMALNRALAAQGQGLAPISEADRRRLFDAAGGAGAALQPAMLASLTVGLATAKGKLPPLPDLSPPDDFDPAPIIAQVSRKVAAPAPAKAAVMPPSSHPTTRPKVPDPSPLSAAAETILTPAARAVLNTFARGRYWPRNTGVVGFDESAAAEPLPVNGPPPRTGTLIIGCMKNEGPYILEWIAYHRAIGVDHFLIFTNDCTDGTDEILDRLASFGIVTREPNDVWKGKSPQQAALRRAMQMPQVIAARWLIHIDIDEFINLRAGNGTLADLYKAMGKATNLAMTWRLFGNNGVDAIGDASVLGRFRGCAPAWCPKPHTIWGFKSISKNIGAYDRLSTHRPNHLDPKAAKKVAWLNGSLQDVTGDFAEKGWRSSTGTIGYDVVQLNHYALRSHQSFLIKRQRGRALHVDRTIGLNYWVRHDWNRHIDRTIERHIPRMQAVLAEFLADPELAELHRQSLEWHRAKAVEIIRADEFRHLSDACRAADLTDAERVAYAVAEDMES